GFAKKVFFFPGVEGQFSRKKFQRDVALELQVMRLVDHTHPAAANLFQNAVLKQSLADERPGVRHGWVLILSAAQRRGIHIPRKVHARSAFEYYWGRL